MEPVAITGAGCITAAGVGLDALEDALFQGRSGIGERQSRGQDGLRIRRHGFVQFYNPADHFDQRTLGLLDSFAQFALVGAREAIEQAGWQDAELRSSETAVILGTGIGGAETQDEQTFRLYAEGATRVDATTVPRLMPSAAVSQITTRYGVRGPSFAVSSACASAAQAIGLGMMLVRSGAVKRAIVGGSEACLTHGGIRSWEALRVLTPGLCRPFSTGRNGMVLGEGAGILTIEPLSAAVESKRPILGILAGYGTSSDGKDMLKPDVEGCANSMRLALEDAQLDPSSIDHVNAHGTGTIANDSTEAAAILSVFGEHGRQVPVTSTKPVHGHTLGAAGAIELIAALLTLRRQQVPATLNYLGADPNCPVNVVNGAPLDHPMTWVMSNSFAFGGINASLVLGAPHLHASD